MDWVTKAKSDIPTRRSVLNMAKAHGEYTHGPLAFFADKIAPGARPEPRFPPEVYRPISDAIQAAQLGGAKPMSAAERAAEQIDTYLKGYKGAPIR
jgi:multiple sugar transport system substrate-binding protein